ncbi:MAG: ASKHA domain-containing protein [Candidatus Bathyarchaeia archaeon]
MLDQVELVVQPIGLRGDVPKGSTVLGSLRKLGVPLAAPCGGRGTCGKCLVKVLDGEENLTTRTSAERALISGDMPNSGYRLACLARLLGPVTVLIPPESMVGRPQIVTEGFSVTAPLNPAVTEWTTRVDPPTLHDLRSDLQRLFDALSRDLATSGFSADLDTVRLLPSKLREQRWEARVILWKGREILEVASPKAEASLYGLAVDIGTTKVAAYLVNLRNGEVAAATSVVNPQIEWGEDVISRITYATDARKTRRLQRAVVEGINHLAEECCLKAGVRRSQIYDVTVAGNTAMHHLFLGLEPKTLGLAPYAPVVHEPVDEDAKRLGLRMNRAAKVHVLPVVAGFVGGDAVADILATRIHEEPRWQLLFDIGTNTEVILARKGALYAASCASGPAFEGARIKHGMRASSGAIEYVKVEPETLAVSYHTIDDEKPRGICGSGVIDAVAQLVQAGVISPSGRMSGLARSESVEGIPEFVIAQGEETLSGSPITLTQQDVREIQLAKAAVLTGATILLREAHVTLEEIERVYMAGAFGSYVRPESAIAISMIPAFPLSMIRAVGNTAGAGARLALTSMEARKEAAAIAQAVRYVELHTFPDFQEIYLKALSFTKR